MSFLQQKSCNIVKYLSFLFEKSCIFAATKCDFYRKGAILQNLKFDVKPGTDKNNFLQQKVAVLSK